MGDLHEDIYFGDINQKFSSLASMAPENWSVSGKNDNSVFKKLFEVHI